MLSMKDSRVGTDYLTIYIHVVPQGRVSGQQVRTRQETSHVRHPGVALPLQVCCQLAPCFQQAWGSGQPLTLPKGP